MCSALPFGITCVKDCTCLLVFLLSELEAIIRPSPMHGVLYRDNILKKKTSEKTVNPHVIKKDHAEHMNFHVVKKDNVEPNAPSR